ncbi:MAG: type I DNA topoisomerase, partial [Microgenomates group bacterium]
MSLVIVESPTKARKLRSYLGAGYTVAASVGHIRDLPKAKLGVDVENDFEPTYETSKDKSKIISELRSLASKTDLVYLATDPDREGEAIAWHVQYILENPSGNAKGVTAEFKRATFHEITKKAVQHALDNPSMINLDLVNAQQARRVVDRLVGYEVSPVLWKKIRRGLSAGRVQSVALRLIVEREDEIAAFKPEEYWEVDVALTTASKAPQKVFSGETTEAKLPSDAFVARVNEINGKTFTPTKESDVTSLVEILPSADFKVSDIEKKTRKRSSLPPFTTSTLQQGAATNYGYSSKQTMRLAQQLYEEGLITYHRTDSVSLSEDAVTMAREYVTAQFGSQYVPDQPRLFKSKSKNAQEAHEAVRVTEVSLTEDAFETAHPSLTPQHKKLYQLIWRRFVASQMSDAQYDQTKVLIAVTPKESNPNIQSAELKANGSIVKFDGWTRLFPDRDDRILPDLEVGQQTNFLDLNAQQKFTQPPPRYNDASLVKELEKRGIGRPSTYASIISVIEDRGYVERKDKRFFATAIGSTVLKFLLEHFPTFMEYEFTAEMEEDLDRISRGEKEWKTIIKEFYAPFHKTVEKVTDSAERAQVPVEKTGEPCP